MFDQLRRDFAGVAAGKGLRLAVDSALEYAHSDPALVGQVLRNLLSNAIKYTHSGSVELRCEKRGERLRIEVRDTGVGIATDQIGHIFEEFYQVGVSPNSSRDGYGLGLSIVNRISRLLDLKIEVKSTPGKGSVFAFELPAANAPPEATNLSGAPESQDKAPGRAWRILLVEDEPGVRNAMRMLLRIEGYEVVPVAGADEAIARMAEEKFDLLITDYHLDGGRTGTQVIEASRQHLGAEFNAVLVTGDTSSAIREMQGDPHLRITSKPINSDELLTLVRNLLAG
jgi:two-component system CheB/CheR fusion protein